MKVALEFDAAFCFRNFNPNSEYDHIKVALQRYVVDTD